MKIYDCTSFFSEHMMYDVRLNILNDKVEKFIVTEAMYSHSGKKKKLNFDIKNYPKFKDKIIYIVIENEPEGIVLENNNPSLQRSNSLKRIALSYDESLKALKDADDNDFIMLSDNDEIPNLNSLEFKNNKNDIILFNQLFFYYKFNLIYDKMIWPGTKGCKKGKLKSLSWLRNIKLKKYPFWRLDTLFSNNKYIDINIINDGGWHFTNIKTPEDIEKKYLNFLHHQEFEYSGLKLEDIKNMVKNNKVLYDHSVDQKGYKWEGTKSLKKISLDEMPDYIKENPKKYVKWLEV